MTPNEQAFVDAMVELRVSERAEQRARQRTYELGRVTAEKQARLNDLRRVLIGHSSMLQTDAERELLFRLIQEADKRVSE